MDATELLKKDHAAVKKLFTAFGRTTARAVKKRQELIDRLAGEIEVHARIEEEIFYPAARGVEGGAELVEHALAEHGDAREMLAGIRGMEMSGTEVADRVKELKQAIQDHVEEEEGELFEVARRLGPDELARLGRELEARKRELAGEEKPRRKTRPEAA